MNLSFMALRKPSRRLVMVAALPLILLAAAGSFYARDALRSDAPESAATPTSPVVRGSSLSTPEPGETPDPTQPDWYLKWVHQDGMRERRDIVVNGFSVGPGVQPQQGTPCDERNGPQATDFNSAQASRVAIHPSYLPFGLSVTDGSAVSCGDEIALNVVLMELPQVDDVDLISRTKRGEDYFALPRGGSIEILRVVAEPAWSSSIPPERWMPGTIAGLPAAIGRPLIDEGFGDSEILIHGDGVLTLVRASNLSLADLLKIAEGLFE